MYGVAPWGFGLWTLTAQSPPKQPVAYAWGRHKQDWEQQKVSLGFVESRLRVGIYVR